ncbi:MAG: exodeoxyribonuclease 7 large subunit [Candidatus Hydrogenedentota bacterium]
MATTPDKPNVLTVSQLTRWVKDLLERQISYTWVSGEISNWRVSPAGHAYFTLKDENSQIDAVIFRGKLMQVQFGPESGLEVIVFGQVTVYEKRGNYQIICEEMHPKGVGALQLAFETLKKKLAGEGLFDDAHKKPLPMLPKRIGIVTSPTGAAIRDILNVLDRRFANVHVILYPARVQGDEAAGEIVEGIRALDRWGVDVMIVGRGGGSLEDLWPFNEEKVVRAIFEAHTPIISAVGHQIDVTLSDFVADLRAPTPSAAAEIVVKEREALLEKVAALRDRQAKALRRQADQISNRLRMARNSFVFQRPELLVREYRQRLDELRMRVESETQATLETARRRHTHAVRSLALLSPRNQIRRASDRLLDLRRRLGQGGQLTVDRGRARVRPLIAQLDALSPLAVLSRGYALARTIPGLRVIRDAGTVRKSDSIEVQLGKGRIFATVERVED